VDPITDFYTAFSELDAEKMIACYADDVVFEDPAFGVLKGDKAKNMWRMLVSSQKGKDFQVTFSKVQHNENSGTAAWEAKYNFSQTGRPVHNVIKAEFVLKEGLITKHTDSFSLRKWAKQALGFKGAVLGGTKFFRKALQKQTASTLQKFEQMQNR
jgi:ketosteroid isomerase-like protein